MKTKNLFSNCKLYLNFSGMKIRPHSTLIITYRTLFLCILLRTSLFCTADENKTEVEFHSGTNEENAKSLKIFKKLEAESKMYESDESKKPPYTYKRLLLQAMFSSPNRKITRHQIFEFVRNKYAFFRSEAATKIRWQHSLMNVFGRSRKSSIFVHYSPDEEYLTANRHKPGKKGGYWSFKPEYENYFMAQAYLTGTGRIRRNRYFER